MNEFTPPKTIKLVLQQFLRESIFTKCKFPTQGLTKTNQKNISLDVIFTNLV